MYAVVCTGGKQYKVAVNDVLRVEKLPAQQGETVEFTDLALISGENGILTGTALEGRKVTASVLVQDRAKKVLIFKKKKRKNYRRKQGHRQAFTEVRITGIE
ncbi:MAG: 50S ribosomal protein L21 [Magnetococcales bacterium]|nr:50S ribosomal protein L21 [Magnetococcales bacterium]